jgi:hypothetical protein
MNNDPESDPQAFTGERRLHYGRGDYTYEVGARLGAAGAIIVHTDASAGYGWQVVQSSWTGKPGPAGAKVADAPLAPSGRPGDEFEAARRKALAELGR